MTKVVHCKKEKYDVYIGRPSKWGNPFVIGRDGDRDEVVRKYELWIKTQSHLMAAIPELLDKTLACWCSPQSCHGDVLVKLVEEWQKKELSVPSSLVNIAMVMSRLRPTS